MSRKVEEIPGERKGRWSEVLRETLPLYLELPNASHSHQSSDFIRSPAFLRDPPQPPQIRASSQCRKAGARSQLGAAGGFACCGARFINVRSRERRRCIKHASASRSWQAKGTLGRPQKKFCLQATYTKPSTLPSGHQEVSGSSGSCGLVPEQS